MRRTIVAACAGALLSALALVTGHLCAPGITWEMARPLPRSTTGVYPIEVAGEESFAWTSGRAVVRLPGLDRRAPWSCELRFRAGRPPGPPRPTLTVNLDGVDVASRASGDNYESLQWSLPRRPSRAGATVALSSQPTFVPGGGDTRELGVQVDRFSCAPSRLWTLPPGSAIVGAAAAGAAWTAAAVVGGMSFLAVLGVGAVVAVGQAGLLVSGSALYGPYPSLLMAYGLSVAVVMAGILLGSGLVRRPPIGSVARAAIAVSSVAAYLEILGLLHPAKPLVDALFQAHRLQWVLDGRYFFTQPMPDGVEFPYAIGLYVMAAPWASLTRDFVTLLRLVVLATSAVAGGLLYWAMVRTWHDRRAGLTAVALFHLVPLPFTVIGNGNLTNAFAQAVALIATILAATLATRLQSLWLALGLTVITALAFSSHISTAVLLAAALMAFAAVLATVGGRPWRASALALAVIVAVAGASSYAAYYRHFGAVYRTALERVGTSDGPAVTGAVAVASPGPVARAGVALVETRDKLGWPVLLLAAIGTLTLGGGALRTPLGCAIVAWLMVWTVVVAAMLVMRVDAQFDRYAIEFLGRVNLAVYPAFLLLAARAVGASVDSSAAVALLRPIWARVMIWATAAAAVVVGVKAWITWFD